MTTEQRLAPLCIVRRSRSLPDSDATDHAADLNDFLSSRSGEMLFPAAEIRRGAPLVPAAERKTAGKRIGRVAFDSDLWRSYTCVLALRQAVRAFSTDSEH